MRKVKCEYCGELVNEDDVDCGMCNVCADEEDAQANGGG